MEQDGDILLKMYDPIWQILSTIYWLKYIYRLHMYFQIRAIFSKKELRYITLYTVHGIMGQNKTKKHHTLSKCAMYIYGTKYILINFRTVFVWNVEYIYEFKISYRIPSGWSMSMINIGARNM